METKKPYVVAIIMQVIYAGMFVCNKAAFNNGFNTFVFVFYSQAAASLLMLPLAVLLEWKSVKCMSLKLLLKLFICALIGYTLTLNMLTVAMRFTSATVQSAIGNSRPAMIFCLALLLRMEVVKLRSSYGIAKMTGVALCVGGVFIIAFFTGRAFSPVNHHSTFHGVHHSSDATGHVTWIKGTFLKLLGDITWSVWIVLQAALLKECPNKMVVTAAQSIFGTMQSLVVAAVAERDISRWKLRLDINLLAVLYTGFVVRGINYYLQVWCMEMKGPVFQAIWTPLCFIFTLFCSSFFLGEVIHLGSILGGILLIGGLYCVLWAKSKETRIETCNDVNTVDVQEDKEQRISEQNQQDTKVYDEETLTYAAEPVQ